MKHIYLDYAAATPMRSEVLDAMQPYFSDKFYNPSATYLAARAVHNDLADLRARAGVVLGARPAEIFFTAGATEANNLAIQGAAHKFPGSEILVSAIEHSSVLEPAKNFDHKITPVNQKGRVDLGEIEKLVTDKTVLVSIIYANNEIGTIQSVAEISQLLNKLSKLRRETGSNLPLYFHSDAAQAGNFLDLHVARLGVDMLSLNGDKLYGPKGTGLLYVKAGVQLEPLAYGGGQELGLRSGTENLAAIAGLVKALELAQAERHEMSARLFKLRAPFIDDILKICPRAYISGDQKHTVPHIINVTFPGQDNERLVMQLDELGVQAAAGSACSASAGEASYVLSAIGLKEDDVRASVRFSLGSQTTAEELRQTAQSLQKIL